MSAGVLTLKHDDISWTSTKEGAVVVLDLRSSQYLSINASASVLWSMLASGVPAETLVETLQTTFGITRDTAQRDVDIFLSDLRDRDLLDEPVE